MREPTACPDTLSLSALAAGAEVEGREDLLEHAADCRRCQAFLADLLSLAAEKPRLRFLPLAAAAALLLAVAGLAGLLHPPKVPSPAVPPRVPPKASSLEVEPGGDACLSGGKLILFGNGGSAADAQHLAAEFVGQFHHVRKGLPALALTVNTSVLTAVSNDFSYEDVFARQVEALVTAKDVVIGISTGGSSANVVRGIERAQQQGAKTIGLLGKSGGLLAKMVDLPLVVPSNSTQRIQEAHITVGHILCTLVEHALCGPGAEKR